MENQLLTIKNNALSLILDAEDAKELEEIRIQFLGRNGEMNQTMKTLTKLSPEDKPKAGQLMNEVKTIIEDAINQKAKTLKQSKPLVQTFDITEPGIKPAIGHLHPMTQVIMDIVDVFKTLGYQAADGPEIETDYYNFEALNIPKDHPARDTQQTFYLDTKNTQATPGEIILRTQLSGMQARIMEKMKPPVRVIVPGNVYRYEQVDASHGFQFGQMEGFLVDKNVRLTDLFGTIDYALRKLMKQEIKLKFATTNFPFVEPGVDTYIECTVCHGKGCSFCKHSGWSEIMPSGMIHPNVLKACGYDPEEYNGFAFCIGLSRLVTLRYHMDDLRLLTNPDLRILEQF
jgi:phenylalanyl-tRNA synthetase alpha chain